MQGVSASSSTSAKSISATSEIGVHPTGASERPFLTLIPIQVVCSNVLPLLTPADAESLKLVSRRFPAIGRSPTGKYLSQLFTFEREQRLLRSFYANEFEDFVDQALSQHKNKLLATWRATIDARIQENLPTPHADALECVRSAIDALKSRSAVLPERELFDALALVSEEVCDVKDLFLLLADGGSDKDLQKSFCEMEARLVWLVTARLHGTTGRQPAQQDSTVIFVDASHDEAGRSCAPTATLHVMDPDRRVKASMVSSLPLRPRVA